jgi:hypothetical protein
MKLHLSPGMNFGKAIVGAKESLRKARMDYNAKKTKRKIVKSKLNKFLYKF